MWGPFVRMVESMVARPMMKRGVQQTVRKVDEVLGAVELHSCYWYYHWEPPLRQKKQQEQQQ